jgi:hypothetical protein
LQEEDNLAVAQGNIVLNLINVYRALGGGLLHWWDPACYPCYGGPDDYCRKSLPKLCWPGPYPSSYIWGPPETCCPRSKLPVNCSHSH